MASPISFGDAYLMGKLALKLGHAFTKGRKSASAEFREVQNQLYSLSTALCSLKDTLIVETASINDSPAQGGAVLESSSSSAVDSTDKILRSCEECLTHLKSVVDQYSCISGPTTSEEKRRTNLVSNLKRNLKKIAWTTEGGDLATLRSQLLVHTNALNLILSVAVNTKIRRVQAGVSEADFMLREIHEWFVINLKGDPTNASLPTSTSAEGRPQLRSLHDTTFELLIDAEGGHDAILLCGRASVNPKWSIKVGETSTANLFECQCHDNNQSTNERPHGRQVSAYALSIRTFPVRIAGKQRSWMIYKAKDKNTNMTVSLLIRNVTLTGIEDFEKVFVQSLANRTTKTMFDRGESNMLAYVDADHQVERRLQIVADTKTIRQSTENITFSTLGRSYTRRSIQEIQILHYQSFDNENPLLQHGSPIQNAEIVVFFVEDDSQTIDDVGSITLILRSNSKPKPDFAERTVLFQQVDCIGLGYESTEQNASSIDVKFQFCDSKAAELFHQAAEDMRMELFIMDLRYPRSNEETLLKLQVSKVRSKDLDIPEADLTIVRNIKTYLYRLIIVSRNGCSILSQKLPSNFLSSMSDSGKPNLRSEAYLVQINRSGQQEVIWYEHGFECLEFLHANEYHLFELGLASLVGKLTL